MIGLCKSPGATGFQQLKISLAQEVVLPVQLIHEDLDSKDDPAAITRKVFHSNVQALHDTQSVLDPGAIEKAVRLIKRAKRIEIYGIGGATTIAEDAHYRMLRISISLRT